MWNSHLSHCILRFDGKPLPSLRHSDVSAKRENLMIRWRTSQTGCNIIERETWSCHLHIAKRQYSRKNRVKLFLRDSQLRLDIHDAHISVP